MPDIIHGVLFYPFLQSSLAPTKDPEIHAFKYPHFAPQSSTMYRQDIFGPRLKDACLGSRYLVIGLGWISSDGLLDLYGWPSFDPKVWFSWRRLSRNSSNVSGCALKPNACLSSSKRFLMTGDCISSQRSCQPKVPSSLIRAGLSFRRYLSRPPSFLIVLRTRFRTLSCRNSPRASL